MVTSEIGVRWVGGQITAKVHERAFCSGRKKFYILIGMVTWVCAFVKTHQTVQLISIHCILKRQENSNKDGKPNQVGP